MDTATAPASPAQRPTDDAPALLLKLAAGAALVALGARRRGVVGTAAGIAGAGVLAAVLAPRAARRAYRAGIAQRAINVKSEIIVPRPRSAVFSFFRNFENIPLLGGMVQSVEDFDDGRSHWRAAGHGAAIEWDVIVSKYVPPNVIAWESTAGAPVESTGTLRFDAIDDATTRVRIWLHYQPRTEAALRVFRGELAHRPERRVRAAIRRIDDAMERALQPDVHHRGPRFPLPDQPVSELIPPPADSPPSQP